MNRITRYMVAALVAALAGPLFAQGGAQDSSSVALRAKWFKYQAAAQRADKPRVIIETDAGGNPDAEQSLVRFLTYANEFDIEGIIANRREARPGENLNPERTGLGIVQRLVRAYGQVQPSLSQNAPGYPTERYLAARTVPGYRWSTAGVNLIIKVVDEPDPRPVWFLNWGTNWGSASSNMRRALDQILFDRGHPGYNKFKNKILLCSADRLRDHTTSIPPAFRLFVDPYADEGRHWYRRWGPLTATAGGFYLRRDVLTGHGALGALYPTNTHPAQLEGDTDAFMYLVPVGMNDPMHPAWGGWAGRFGVRQQYNRRIPTYYVANVQDRWHGTVGRGNTLRRWAVDIQDDFRARMDWCVKPWAECNHPPVALLNGDATERILSVDTHAGATVKLSAAGSWDPDGNALAYDWIPYPEAGGYNATFWVSARHAADTTVTVPADAAGHDLHVILAVHDNGSPPLVAYRRIILHVQPGS